MSSRSLRRTIDPVRVYIVCLVNGQKGLVYVIGDADNHQAALASALQQHQQAGHDKRLVTTAWVSGSCSDPTCGCSHGNQMVRYALHPVRAMEVCHL